MNTYDKATTSSKESKLMSSTWVQLVQIYENREPINKLCFVGNLTIRPPLVLFMLVPVCSAVEGGLEGGGGS